MLALAGCAPASAKDTGLSNAAPSAGAVQEITREAAQKIALDHAGLTADAVTRLHAEYDRDRINHYEISFHYNGYEYDYNIHAETGEILDFERELED